ncbi:MarR family winged helix-turn-helix transcriptional regulator [Pseudonocardia sp. RS010]|uniref:MarR family winged helix-turn-helix transcriptional regulator n=1 Tax=Pseudonocardia sp. RS010 TaxID=3385979 RepID=UPI00399FD81E
MAGDLRAVLGQLVRRLREQNTGVDLTKSQASVLGRLEREGPSTATALAKAEGLRPQSMGSIVTALETAGLITRSPDPGDGRKTILRLSDGAKELYRTGRLAREDWLTQAMTATLTADEIDRIAGIIELLDRIARS